MSAPIAATTMARLTILTFHPINIKAFVGCGACGYVGEGEHFSAFRARSGDGGSGASRQSRSSTYPQSFLVNLPRRAIAEALVLALLIVEIVPGADAGLGLGDRRIGVEVDFLVFEASPQPLDENVVHGDAPPRPPISRHRRLASDAAAALDMLPMPEPRDASLRHRAHEGCDTGFGWRDRCRTPWTAIRQDREPGYC